MIISSPLDYQTYLNALQERMGDHSAFGSERFTGFFLGRLFCVTYHSGYEWNRKITNQKNGAVGIVKKHEDGCYVYFLHMKGPLCPPQFLMLLFACLVLSLFALFIETGTVDLAITIFGLSLVYILIMAPIGALIESTTDRSAEGEKVLISTLLDPTDPFAYLTNKDGL